jgi:hypothetical protein
MSTLASRWLSLLYNPSLRYGCEPYSLKMSMLKLCQNIVRDVTSYMRNYYGIVIPWKLAICIKIVKATSPTCIEIQHCSLPKRETETLGAFFRDRHGIRNREQNVRRTPSELSAITMPWSNGSWVKINIKLKMLGSILNV